MLLTRRRVLQIAAGLPILAAGATRAFASKEFWESKPSTEWNPEEVERMLIKSPWAKDAPVAFNSGPGSLGPGTDGGIGYPDGGMGYPGGGMGYPGGGMGYPGGGMGYPGGGMGYPGGGMGYPGGGQPGGLGYPGGNAGGGNGRGRPSGGGRERGLRAIVRWESALPVQEALRTGSSGQKPDPDFAKYYVLALIGDLPMVGGHRRGANDNDDDDTVQNERRQEMFKQYTKLERKGGPVELEKIQEGSRVGGKGPGTYFYFSRLDGISMDDRQVAFSTKLGPMEIKTKFILKDMLYHGKLAL